VRYPAPDKSNVVVVIDLYNNNKMSRKPTKKAEAALMHTNHNIIVLKGKVIKMFYTKYEKIISYEIKTF
jgi:hypothetical protein